MSTRFAHTRSFEPKLNRDLLEGGSACGQPQSNNMASIKNTPFMKSSARWVLRAT